MPFRSEGLYRSWLHLLIYDDNIHKGNQRKKNWIKSLSKSSTATIKKCLEELNISEEDTQLFLTLTLTTLPGWAAHIKYRTYFQATQNIHPYPVTQEDYIALRLVIIYLTWPMASSILDWHKEIKRNQVKVSNKLETIKKAESNYSSSLLTNLLSQKIKKSIHTKAQLVFCIDVRSEPLRRAIEQQDNYTTFGFAGFFGIPVQIENSIKNESYASCPVLLEPKHSVDQFSDCSNRAYTRYSKGQKKLTTAKTIYQSLKNNILTPFSLVESIGLAAGIWMGIKTFSPKLAFRLKNKFEQKIGPKIPNSPSLKNISFKDQCTYAKNALEMIGLTTEFSPLVVFCGHGSKTENNAYSSFLECGACGGHNGSTNAQLLVKILNKIEVRHYLAKQGISVPAPTLFIAAAHNTTTDAVELFLTEKTDFTTDFKIKNLNKDLKKAQQINSEVRSKKMNTKKTKNTDDHTFLRSIDWSQTRPEWGLAGNASFIAAPRELTQNINLEGKSFLHSYRYEQDPNGKILTSILTAPMIVAQWINSQYLFSSIDNVAYGSGSKITKNITGKLGVMQGNASDLMHGLPLQSLFIDDQTSYHTPVRLLTIIYAQRDQVLNIIKSQKALTGLAQNGWVHFTCIDPETNQCYFLERNLTWSQCSPNKSLS